MISENCRQEGFTTGARTTERSISIFPSYSRWPLCYRCILQKPKGRLGRPSPSIKNQNYFLGAIASLAALATRNFTTVLALI